MKLEHRFLEAKEYLYKVNHDVCETGQVYAHLQKNIKELREGWIALCEVLKTQNDQPYRHQTELTMLEQRMHTAYRDVRLASLRTFMKIRELLAENKRAYMEYMSLKKQCRKSKEDESCVRM